VEHGLKGPLGDEGDAFVAKRRKNSCQPRASAWVFMYGIYNRPERAKALITKAFALSGRHYYSA
jgi:hypothetical protein